MSYDAKAKRLAFIKSKIPLESIGKTFELDIKLKDDLGGTQIYSLKVMI